jgi:iron complex transport system substrate-binding protein
VRRFSVFILLIVGCITLVSCGGEGHEPVGPTGPARIVSLAPSITDILDAIGAGPQVVGVCAPSPPRPAPRPPVVASFGTVNVERVFSLKPDLCATIRGMQDPAALADLRRLGLNVVEYPAETLDQLWACMEDLGRRAGREKEGRNLSRRCRERVARVGAPAGETSPRALLLVSADPIVLAGEGTFLSEVLGAAGFANGAAPLRGYPQVGLEPMARGKPGVLVFPEGDLPREAADGIAETLGKVAGAKLEVVGVPADLLVRPGPGTPRAVELLAAARLRMTRSVPASAPRGDL